MPFEKILLSCCRVAVKRKKVAYKRYLKNPNEGNYILYKKSNAEAKKVVRESKRNSWLNFLAGTSW